ncbi:MAG: hypothetical protein J1D77_00100 [Muribaculaceae bacterium]|nr:hypothetical protein [Muribaculaceae bacterium]
MDTTKLSETGPAPLYDTTAGAIAYADSVLTLMTLEERVGQCLMPSIFAADDTASLRKLRHFIEDFHIGGVVLLRGNKKAVKNIVDLASVQVPPLFIAIDAEWGLGMRLDDGGLYPKNAFFGSEADESLMYDYGREVAGESREIGVNMILGPVVDITSSRYGIIGERSFGSDPVLVANLGVAYAKGLESGGVVSVAKHFPGHGSAVADSHRSVAAIRRDISGLDSIDLRPFREYINAGLSGVMAGHISSKALDPDGNPASVSMDMLTSLLREELGFKGLILTDAFDMGGARGFSAVDALKAGADLILCPDDIAKEYRLLLESVTSGALPLSLLNDRCRRILFFKSLFLK